MLPSTTEVAIVGAGPTGLAAACTLRRAGIEPLVLDKNEEQANTSRAAVIHARTLEVLEDLDVTTRLLAEGCVVPVFTIRDRSRILARVDFAGLPTSYPFTLMLPQWRTEAILTRRLEELGGRVARPYRVTGVTAQPHGAQVAVEAPDGRRETVTARYVIGADGMASAVRESAGIPFTGGRYDQSFVLADVRMEWPLPADEVQLFFAAAGLVVVAPLPGGAHRVVATLDDAPQQIQTADVQQLIDVRGPGEGRVTNIVWASRFRVHHRVADVYRVGPLLLAGDAAHVHSPAGGQGMNLGIQDAVDLAQALSDVLSGGAPDASLDGYQRRRHTIAQRTVAITDRVTRMATLTSPIQRTARNAVLTVGGHVPAARRQLAFQLAGLPVR
jgi:2-polyprenyl-6-methoxyphenol hydroxylase-like FAD-dependent oxidoreductase